MINKLFLSALLVIAFSINVFAEIKPVKYVFLFIGDGMSIPQRMTTEQYLKLSNKEGLAINKLKNQAITHTSSANSFITDSAASGTAIACGEKTKNGAIGVNTKQKNIESIAYVAQKAGKKVGIITSVPINHATPAAFYAHNVSRSNYYDIALDMIDSKFDYFGGGVVLKFDDKKSKKYNGNIYELAKKAGYDVYAGVTEEQLDNIKPSDKKVIALSVSSIPNAIDAKNELRLADFVEKGIEILDNPKGFFIMAEGGKIDWHCHANDASAAIKETMDFDNAVKVALEFAEKHPDDTLIVVTGDHETGGLTLGFEGTGYTSHIDRLGKQKYSNEIFAQKVKNILKKNPNATLKDYEELLEDAFSLKLEGNKKDPMVITKKEAEKLEKVAKDAKLFVRAVCHCFAGKAGVAWTSNAHTALPVLTTATGKGAENFSGSIDNTDIAKILKKTVK